MLTELKKRILKAQKFVEEHNAQAQPKDKVDIDPVVLASFADELLPSKKDISREDFIARLKLIMLPDKERPLHAVNEDMLIRGREDTKVDPTQDKAIPHKLDIDPAKLMNQEIKDVAEIKKRNLDMQIRAIKKNTKERHLHELYELGKKHFGLENTTIAPSVQSIYQLPKEAIQDISREGRRAFAHGWIGSRMEAQDSGTLRHAKARFYPGRAARNVISDKFGTILEFSPYRYERNVRTKRYKKTAGTTAEVGTQNFDLKLKDPAEHANQTRNNEVLKNIFQLNAHDGTALASAERSYYRTVGSGEESNHSRGRSRAEVIPNFYEGRQTKGLYEKIEKQVRDAVPAFLRAMLMRGDNEKELSQLQGESIQDLQNRSQRKLGAESFSQGSKIRKFVAPYLNENIEAINKFNNEYFIEQHLFKLDRQTRIQQTQAGDTMTRAINESDAQARKLTEEKYHQIKDDRANILREIDIKNKEIWELQKLYGFEKIRNLTDKDIKDNKTNRRYGAPKFDVMPEQYYQLGDLTDDPVIRGLDLKQFVESQKEDKFKVGRGKYTFDKKNMLATIDRAYQTKDASILGRYIKRLNEDLQNDFSFQERTTPAQREFEAAKLIKLRNDRKLLYRALDKEDKKYLNQVMYSINAYTAFPHEYSVDIAKKHFKLLSDITRTHGTPVNLEPDNREKTRNYDYHINNIRMRLDYDVPAVKTQELGGALYEDRYQSMLKAYNDYVQPAEKEKKVRYPKTNAQKIAGLYRQETGDLNTDRISDNYLRARAVYQDELDKKRWNEIVNSKQNNLANKNRFNILFGQLRGAESVRNTVNNLPHGTFDFYENFLRRKQ